MGTPGCQLDDLDAWRAANPAMRPGRITTEAIATERHALRTDPLAFARERLGWHAEPTIVANGIAPADWNAMRDPDAAPTGELHLALDASPDHKSAAIVAFGTGVAEVIDHHGGVAWLPKRTAELVTRHGITAPVGIDPDGPAGALIPDLEAAGVRLQHIHGKDTVRATAALVAAVRDRTFRHRPDPDLDAAVSAARRRKVGEGHRWTRVDSAVDISPLVALTTAHWLATSTPAPVPMIHPWPDDLLAQW